ncbi:MAG TPA: branched-chain amino acid ABC transporter permease [Solirubrobacteraceae bacterium]|nr:branched-chain amino acid ABC transporter permease [Solirubrobacteraceae bacterium]
MAPILYYGFTLLFFFAAYCVLGWGLNLQFGESGILNFAYIAFVAIGAYIAGVTSSGPPLPGSGQSYVLGATLPFPLGLLAGGVASCLLAVLVAFIAFRRLRSDYLAMVLISISLVMYDFINNYVPLFDGADGLNSVPMPLASTLGLNANSFLIFFAVLTVVIGAFMWLIMSRITRSPLGRTLRAIRDDPDVVSALGKNVFRYQLTAMLIGAFYAGIGGGLIVEFSSSFNTSAWTVPETFIIFAALIIGGLGNNVGVMVGAFVVPVLFTQLPKFIPDIPGHPGLILNLEGAVIGVLLILTMWFRPQGIIPERVRRPDRFLARRTVAAPADAIDADQVDATASPEAAAVDAETVR